jgi:hypothetical protein
MKVNPNGYSNRITWYHPLKHTLTDSLPRKTWVNLAAEASHCRPLMSVRVGTADSHASAGRRAGTTSTGYALCARGRRGVEYPAAVPASLTEWWRLAGRGGAGPGAAGRRRNFWTGVRADARN